jgi:predicted dehydrogenase
MDYLIDAEPESVSATGQCHLNGLEDMAYVTIYFSEILAHINVNWLSPVKVRTTLLGGEKKMVMWNDLEADEKVKIYDKGVEISNGQGVYDLLVSYRSGDMWAPKIDQTEALKLEAKYFVECLEKNETPFNDGIAGLRVVRLLEAATQSLKDRGKPVQL